MSEPIGRRRLPQLIEKLVSRPTLIAQGVSAATSLALITLLTRSLSPEDFGGYATVLATYTFGSALIGTSIGTRAIEAISTGAKDRVQLSFVRDVPITLAAAIVAACATTLVRVDTVLAVAAATGMVGMMVDQVATSHMLGHHRYWRYASMVFLRMAVWLAAVVLAIGSLPRSAELAGVLFATAVGCVPPAAYLVFAGAVDLSRAPDIGQKAPVSLIGLSNLALWLLASADRLILAPHGLADLATYAALYGLLDRAFRTVTTAEMQQRLPRAFAAVSRGEDPRHRPSLGGAVMLLLCGLVVGLAAPTVVEVISGGNYSPDLWMSLVLTFGMLAMLAAVPAYAALTALGLHRAILLAAVVPAVVNISGNLVLAPSLGTTSAAVLTLVGYLIWLIGVSIALVHASPPSRPGA